LLLGPCSGVSEFRPEPEGALAIAAARATSSDFVGVDLLPLPKGGYTEGIMDVGIIGAGTSSGR